MTEAILKLKKWRCKVCGYIYDPEAGVEEQGIEAGIAFEDLPGDWRCPVCGIEKSEFEPIEV